MINFMDLDLAPLRKIFEKFLALKLVYVFGSRARGQAGVLSDYDFAVYFDETSAKRRFDLGLELQAALMRCLKVNEIDMVFLNDTDGPELKYSIIQEGKLIYEVEPFKVIVEPMIMNEYFDFHDSLVRYGLTKDV